MLIRIFEKYINFKYRKKGCISDKAKLGFKFKIIGLEIKQNLIVGDNASLYCVINIQDNGKVTIGKNTTIRYNTEIECVNNIKIGDNVIISNNVIITDNNSHPTSTIERQKLTENGEESELWKWKYSKNSPVVIENNVWIGRRAIILKGVTIGSGSIVAASSVVTKNVPPNSICYGNPAQIKSLD